jgi:hypothetical protein
MLLSALSILARAQSCRPATVAVMVVMRAMGESDHSLMSVSQESKGRKREAAMGQECALTPPASD